MKLQFPHHEIAHWAEKYDQYDYAQQETNMIAPMRPQVKKCGFLTLDQLRVVARWKSPRSARRIEKNDDHYVRTITKFALQTKDDRAKIESLTLLDGVRWPTGSVILHFFDAEDYPILDYRALWSVTAEVPAEHDFPFWWEYVKFCRTIADLTGHSMRTLDRRFGRIPPRTSPHSEHKRG